MLCPSISKGLAEAILLAAWAMGVTVVRLGQVLDQHDEFVTTQTRQAVVFLATQAELPRQPHATTHPCGVGPGLVVDGLERSRSIKDQAPAACFARLLPAPSALVSLEPAVSGWAARQWTWWGKKNRFPGATVLEHRPIYREDRNI